VSVDVLLAKANVFFLDVLCPANVNISILHSVSDHAIPLSEQGVQQAQSAGKALKVTSQDYLRRIWCTLLTSKSRSSSSWFMGRTFRTCRRFGWCAMRSAVSEFIYGFCN
jgi:hypothetical protein